MFSIFGLSFQLPFEDREFNMFAYITKEYGQEIVAAISFLDLQNQNGAHSGNLYTVYTKTNIKPLQTQLREQGWNKINDRPCKACILKESNACIHVK